MIYISKQRADNVDERDRQLVFVGSGVGSIAFVADGDVAGVVMRIRTVFVILGSNFFVFARRDEYGVATPVKRSCGCGRGGCSGS